MSALDRSRRTCASWTGAGIAIGSAVCRWVNPECYPLSLARESGAGSAGRLNSALLCTPLERSTGSLSFPEQAIELLLDHRVALTGTGLQAQSVEHGDAAAAVVNQPGTLQFPGGLGDALAPHSQHIGDQFLGHGQLVGRQPIEA